MVDNKRMKSYTVDYLRHLTFEQQADIWERHCSTCPFSTVRTIENNKIKEHKNIEEARSELLTEYNEKYILRGCNYAEQDFSLIEICMNTCRFWKTETCEGGSGQPDCDSDSFIEIYEEQSDPLLIIDDKADKIIREHA